MKNNNHLEIIASPVLGDAFFLAKNRHKHYNIHIMDPNANLAPGAAPAPEPLAPEPLSPNPATDVANAALAGATPVVTTTDPNAADVAPEPALQAPVLAPSADFQMSEVATVSAVQNGADGNLAAAAENDEVMVGAPLEPSTSENPMDDPNVDQLANSDGGNESQTTGQEAADFNDPDAAAAAEAAAANKANKDDEEDDEPIVAAAPVPGSIGSAKSYADIQRAEAEKAAKVAAKQGKSVKLNKNTILIIIIAVIAVIGIGVGAFLMLSGNSSSTPTITVSTTSYPDEPEKTAYSTLSCKRNLASEEYGSYGAVSGIQENIFYFKDEEQTLDGLITNFSYTYGNVALAEVARNTFMRDYGVTKEGQMPEHGSASEIEEPTTDDESETESSTTKTAAQMLHHYVWLKDYTVTHGMEIESSDIEAWLASDNYSDKTYGATEDGSAVPLLDGETEEDVARTETGELVRNLKYYNRLQNNINYDCIITKGY